MTSPCTIRMPRFITDCWMQVSKEKLAISRILSQRTQTSPRRGRSRGQRIRAKIPKPTPETYWEITVASAAPATPRFSPITNHRSRAIFKTADTAKKISGVTESPMARR